MQPFHFTQTGTRDALAAFLDAHIGVPWRDDIGPLIGLATVARDRGVPDAETLGYWDAAVSAAVSSEAARVRDRISS